MKIWWQSSTPIHRLHDYHAALTGQLNSLKRPETEVHVHGVDDGSMDLHYSAGGAMNSYGPGGVLNKIMQAAEREYDAVAIGCFLDPALQEARELVPIPVFGLGETSMLMACMYGHKFSGIAFHSKQSQYYDRKAWEYGLASATSRLETSASISMRYRPPSRSPPRCGRPSSRKRATWQRRGRRSYSRRAPP